MEQNQHEMTVAGVKLYCPYKPYPAQVQLMFKIIQSIDRKENSLLESPTGSGKTMALLCSSLAWQVREKEKRRQEEIIYEEAIRKAYDTYNKVCADAEKEPEFAKPSDCKARGPTSKAAATTQPEPSACKTTDASCCSAITASSTPKRQLPSSNSSIRPRAAGDCCVNIDDYDDDDDFKTCTKRFRMSSPPVTPSTPKSTSVPKRQPVIDSPSPLVSAIEPTTPMEKSIDIDTLKPRRVPKIFYGTRTHRQIEQIIRELKKTVYRKTKMCILGSREYTCVHPSVSKMPNKHEECRKLVRPLQQLSIHDNECNLSETTLTRNSLGSSCTYYSACKSTEFRSNPGQGMMKKWQAESVWDIEDLVQLGRKKHFCPYFFSRDLMVGADIIFCPYNYLIDPTIRESMEINLADQILVLDEAHNMEDFAREAASFEVTAPDLEDTLAELYSIAKLKSSLKFWRACHIELAVVVSKLLQWLNDTSEQTTDYSNHDKKSKVISGMDMLAVLKHCGITVDSLKDFIDYFKETNIEFTDTTEKEDALKFQHYLAYRVEPPNICTVTNVCKQRLQSPAVSRLQRLSGTPNSVLDKFTHVLPLFFQDFPNYVPDYRVAIISAIGKIKPLTGDSPKLNAVWKSTRDNSKSADVTSGWVVHLYFWCLNPAVAFKYIKEKTRSIVLTSGTLTPMDSFQSELDVKFLFQFSANHVVSDSQIWVGALGVGPTNCELNASYKCASTFQFQDECGRSVLEICRVVPNGVLCFFTSYSLLEKLTSRWQETQLWDELESRKAIFTEPRNASVANFNQLMSDYHDAAESIQPVANGALFLAVYRGKLSEGVDFSDNAARAVISIGIPYPNFVDLQVQEKRKFNDMHKVSRSLVNGHKWYEIQAFRALNQAFGRCIRHKNDWGAVIIIEDRFVKNEHYSTKLCKWVGNNLQRFTRFDEAVNGLRHFVLERKNVDAIQNAIKLENCCGEIERPSELKSLAGFKRKTKGVVFEDSD